MTFDDAWPNHDDSTAVPQTVEGAFDYAVLEKHKAIKQVGELLHEKQEIGELVEQACEALGITFTNNDLSIAAMLQAIIIPEIRRLKHSNDNNEAIRARVHPLVSERGIIAHGEA